MIKVLIVSIIFLVVIFAIIFVIHSIVVKVRSAIRPISNIISVMNTATEEKQSTPIRPSYVDITSYDNLETDFPEYNNRVGIGIIENAVLAYLYAKKGDNSKLEGVKQFCSASFYNTLCNMSDTDSQISNFNIHTTSFSNYSKDNESAVAVYHTSLEYKKQVMHQHLYEISYVYFLEYGAMGENESLKCKICGGAIDTLGDKICPYCDAEIKSSIERTWKVNSIKQIK